MDVATTTWTEDRVETLKALWTQGYSASQIARRLGGVSRNAVIGKLSRMGLRRAAPSLGTAKPADATARFRWTDERDLRLREMFGSGAMDDEIAKALGTSDWSIISRRKVLRLLRERASPAPKFSIAGNGAVFEQTDSAPKLPPVSVRAWEPLPGSTPVPMMSLGPRMCKWPVEIVGAKEAHFCGCIAIDDDPYCVAHRRAEHKRSVQQNGSAKPKPNVPREFSHAAHATRRAA